MAIINNIGKYAPIAGTALGTGVGAWFGGPAGAMIGGSLGGAAGSALSAGLAMDQKPKVAGATGLERSAAQRARDVADELLSMGGLDETQYSRMVESLNEVVNAQNASLITLARESKQSPLVIDKLVREQTRKSTLTLKKGLADISSDDIETAINNLKQGVPANVVAGQLAQAVGTVDRDAAERRRQIKESKQAALMQALGGLTKTTAMAVSQIKTNSDQPQAAETAETTGTIKPQTGGSNYYDDVEYTFNDPNRNVEYDPRTDEFINYSATSTIPSEMPFSNNYNSLDNIKIIEDIRDETGYYYKHNETRTMKDDKLLNDILNGRISIKPKNGVGEYYFVNNKERLSIDFLE